MERAGATDVPLGIVAGCASKRRGGALFSTRVYEILTARFCPRGYVSDCVGYSIACGCEAQSEGLFASEPTFSETNDRAC